MPPRPRRCRSRWPATSGRTGDRVAGAGSSSELAASATGVADSVGVTSRSSRRLSGSMRSGVSRQSSSAETSRPCLRWSCHRAISSLTRPSSVIGSIPRTFVSPGAQTASTDDRTTGEAPSDRKRIPLRSGILFLSLGASPVVRSSVLAVCAPGETKVLGIEPMTEEGRVSELIARWQDHRKQGRDVSAEELCRETPDLLEPLKRRLERLVTPTESATPVADAASSLLEPAPATLSPVLPDVAGHLLLQRLGRGG